MARTTTPPPQAVVIYDGHCVFCTRSKDQLRRILRDDGVEYLSFRDQGALERFPGLNEDECDLAMQYIDERGRLFSGAEAAVRAVLRRPWYAFAWLYYTPGLRQLADWVYRHIARRRFGISGRSSECNAEVCTLPAPESES